MIYQKQGIINFPQEVTGECEMKDFNWQWTGYTFDRPSGTYRVTVEMWELHAKRTVTYAISLDTFTSEDIEGKIDAAILAIPEFENSTAL